MKHAYNQKLKITDERLRCESLSLGCLSGF